MPAARTEPLCDQRSRAVEKDDPKVRCCAAKNIAIGAFERGAGYDEAVTGVSGLADSRGKGAKPSGAILIGERNARGHSIHVFRRMIVVAVGELEAKLPREGSPDQTLPGTRHSHDDVYTGAHRSSFIGRYGQSSAPVSSLAIGLLRQS